MGPVRWYCADCAKAVGMTEHLLLGSPDREVICGDCGTQFDPRKGFPHWESVYQRLKASAGKPPVTA